MRSLLLSLLLVLAFSVAVAPSAEARNFCVAGVDAWCPGVFCRYDPHAKLWRCVDRPDCSTLPCDCTCPPDRLLP